MIKFDFNNETIARMFEVNENEANKVKECYNYIVENFDTSECRSFFRCLAISSN